MAKIQYFCVRVNALTWQSLGAMAAHGERDYGDTSHCDPALLSLNEYGSDLPDVNPKDLVSCAKALISARGAHIRKGSSRVAAEVLYTASPAFFGLVGEEGETPDPDKVRVFKEIALAQANRRWPGMVIAHRYDLDESTPHLSVFVVGISERRGAGGKTKTEVSYADYFGGHKSKMVQLQTELAADFEAVGLSRGESKLKTKTHHMRPKEMREELKRILDRTKARAEAVEGDAADAEVKADLAAAVLMEARAQRAAAEADRKSAATELAAAVVERKEASRLMTEARRLYAFAADLAEQAQALLPHLIGVARDGARALVAGVGRFYQLLNSDPTSKDPRRAD